MSLTSSRLARSLRTTQQGIRTFWNLAGHLTCICRSHIAAKESLAACFRALRAPVAREAADRVLWRCIAWIPPQVPLRNLLLPHVPCILYCHPQLSPFSLWLASEVYHLACMHRAVPNAIKMLLSWWLLCQAFMLTSAARRL